MPDEYLSLVADLKNLIQLDENDNETVLPMAEDGWTTRPETVSYGLVSLDFEVDSLTGDDQKKAASYEGSVDLFSLVKSGAGWVPMIREVLTEHCGAVWYLNHHTYEQNTGLWHWEWAFQVEE